jgi:23S rRNA pseudouridine1911/1915/1917 synthase
MFRQGVRTKTCDSPKTLLEFVARELAQESPPPDLSALDLIELGAVYVNEARSLASTRVLSTGDEVRIHTQPRRFARPLDLAQRITAETDETLTIEKPAGLPAEPTVDNVRENLLSFVEDLRGQQLFLTHRLEAETAGLMLLAKTASAAESIKQAFADGLILRRYVAYLEAPIATGTQGDLQIHSCSEQRTPTSLLTEGRTTWSVEGAPLEVTYRVELEAQRLRPKELRELLKEKRAPIVGDEVSGSQTRLTEMETGKKSYALKAIALTLKPRA